MKILVPVDGSGHALDAVRFALRLHAQNLSASFVLATIQEPTYLYEMQLAPGADALDNVLGVVGSRALEGAEALFKSAGVAFERERLSFKPAPTRLAHAAQWTSSNRLIGHG